MQPLPWSTPFLRRIAVPGARPEIGVAVGIRPGHDGQEVLVSYNPRQRSVAFRLRIGRALKGMGFSLGWLRALSPLIVGERGSWVIGLEAAAGRLTGTLYIEELDRFFSAPELEALWRQTAAALALPLPPPIALGSPYILAVDFEPRGATRLKRYHLRRPGAGPLPEKWRVPEVLRPDAGGHILQRRGEDDSLKVYRCYPYAEHPEDAPAAWQDWHTLTGQPPPLSLSGDTPVTSIGARLVGDHISAAVVYTVPRCGMRRSASSPKTSM